MSANFASYKKANFQSYYQIIIAFTFGCSCSLVTVGQAIADEGETNTGNPQTPEVQLTPTNPQTAGSLTITPTTLQQTGNNNFANVNSNVGALNYPSCSGSCFFGILRTTPNNNNFSGTISNQIEAVIGIIIAIDSPERANVETNRMIVDIQRSKNEYEIKLTLGEKLADAIELGKMERAKIIAILLAPLLGKTHTQLLAEIFAKR
jgi:hypothetical protein